VGLVLFLSVYKEEPVFRADLGGSVRLLNSSVSRGSRLMALFLSSSYGS
jgi:hypothetical protein